MLPAAGVAANGGQLAAAASAERGRAAAEDLALPAAELPHPDQAAVQGAVDSDSEHLQQENRSGALPSRRPAALQKQDKGCSKRQPFQSPQRQFIQQLELQPAVKPGRGLQRAGPGPRLQPHLRRARPPSSVI